MIRALAAAIALAAAPATPSTAPPSPAPPASSTPALSSSLVLARYKAALNKAKDPPLVSFEYTLEQTGHRTLEQMHRVFRSGPNERDETLVVDGKRLVPPTVRIFRGRRNRYTVAALAPRLDAYDFSFRGTHRSGRHVDYVFDLAAKKPGPFTITQLTIDGMTFLPGAIAFATRANEGRGTVSFGKSGPWWVATGATAHARVNHALEREKLTFGAYRFPRKLPPSTFSQPKPLPTFKPATL